MLIKIDPDVVRRCKIFSDNFWEMNHEYYKGSNANSFKATLSLDKISEFSVYDYLTDYEGFKCNSPNLRVEHIKYKKYNPYFTFNKTYKVYTKTIDENTAKANGIVWNFDRNLPFVKLPTLYDYVALTFIDKDRVQIMGIYKADILKDLYKESKVSYYKDKYVSLTWTDIKSLPKMEKEKL